ncbi:choice-of-anchor U domain-containing protein [Halopseudomonas salegens]|uniref:IPTL-CTERM protein sorting domain-containing protein n=1 Tax=Halopseudomonas salegens TaxID=1434072 RepID=A0A1H2EPT4_9GAMM|nr:choice-of-anchor U domain-containing protein [Halopseudomonas salegens]SDT97101.1 hypothetical protein SAMN05216210_0929 [Halopseudomonas salegens]
MHGIRLLAWSLAACFIGFSGQLQAITFSEDVEVLGSLCIGFDCFNGRDLTGSSIVLPANNTRVRFLEPAVDNGPEKGWNLEANDNNNGGPDYFNIGLKGTEADGTPLLSVPGIPVLGLGVASDGYVTLGREATIVAGEVSVGRSDSLRPVSHVAAAVDDTDVLNRHSMDAVLLQTRLQARRDRLTELTEQVALLESMVNALEQSDPDGDGIPTIDDAFPLAATQATIDGISLSVQPLSGASSCSISTLGAEPLASLPSAPETLQTIERALSFTLENCSPGEMVNIAINFGRSLPGYFQAYKLGTPWQLIPDSRVEGSILRYSLTDGGPFDADGLANGVIVDPVTAAAFPPDGIPSTNQWGLLLLVLMLMGSAARYRLARRG